MKTFFSAVFIGLSVFTALDGFIAHDGQPKLIKFPKLKRPLVNRTKSTQLDQEFLGFLWNLKSDLSAGTFSAGLGFVSPKHYLSDRMHLVLRLSSETGTPITPLLNRFIKQVKYQIELKQEIASELASTKATVLVLATLPLIGILLSFLIGINSMQWLFGTSLGRFALVIGAALNLFGWLWVNQIIKKALSV